jgi:uncharacterized membrane protein YeaQ/YmgE (transglycosylase-associated protein family)
MGIIAWIVLGLGAGLLANMAIPGRRSQGLILTCVIGIAGALGGGWAATRLFHVHTLNGFFNLSTWLTAIAGAVVLLLIFHLISARSGTAAPVRGARNRSGGGRYGPPASGSNSDPVGAENALTSRDLRMLVSEAMSADNPVTAVDLVSPAGPGNAKV